MRKEKKSLYLILVLMSFFCALCIHAQDLTEVTPTGSSTTPWVTPETLSQEVTPIFKTYFTIQQPEPDTITTNKTLIIKGENGYHTKVFIDDQEAKRNKSGSFEHPITFNDYGKHAVLITFTLPDFKAETILRKVLYLHHADEAVSSTIYFSDMSRSKSPSESVSRAELAYFLSKLIDKNNVKAIIENKTVLSDVPEDHWARKDIRHVVSKGILTPFSDNTFRPDADVSKMDYIVAVVRALDIGLSSATSLPYSDIEHNWMMPYVKAAYRKNLIPDAPKLLPQTPLTEAQFISWAGHVKDVAKDAKELMDFSKGYTFTQNDLTVRLTPVSVYFEKWHQHDLEMNLLRVTQNKTVTPSAIVATQAVQLIPTASTKKKLSISTLPSYPDLKGHWVNKVATELRYLGILDADPLFDPKKIMTEQDVSMLYLKAFNALPPVETMTFQPEHVMSKEESFKVLQSVSDASQTLTNATRPITKAEFVTLLSKTRPIQARIKEIFEP